MKRILNDGSVENKKVKSGGNIVTKKDYWTNESVRIVKSVPCYIPKYISKIMKAIDKKFKRTEFSIFGVIDYNKNENQFELDPVYYVPKQKVSSSSVDYLEDAPEGFNLVIHKHPTGCRSFSNTDDTYINQNFDYSIIWEGGKFPSGQMRLKTKFGMLSLSLDIKEEEEELPTISDDQLNKIEESIIPVYRGRRGYRGSWEDCEDYTDYLCGGGYGYGKNNKSLGFHSKKSKKHKKHRGMRQSNKREPFEKGTFLTKEQEEVHNFIEAQREELIDYIEEVDSIVAEKNISWEEAEKIYLEEHKDSIHESLLDFNGPSLGTSLDIESEGLKGV